MNTAHARVRFLHLVAVIGLVGVIAVYLIGAVPRPAASEPAAPATAATPAPPAATFVGSETCTECHGEVATALKTSPHGLAMQAAETKGRGYQCEGCHGPGSLHAGDPSAETAATLRTFAASNAGCLQCHEKKLSSAEWLRSDHHREGVSCLSCHGAAHRPAAPAATDKATAEKSAQTAETAAAPAAFDHAAFTRAPDSAACFTCHTGQRAEFSLPSHHPVKEGRVGCADCHDPHRPLNDKVKRDVCVTCHVKQRGPHLYAHGAISGGRLTDGCLSCHQAHGSPNRKLVRLSGRGLCLQCHADRATHAPGRNCATCHRAVHGSNTSQSLFRE